MSVRDELESVGKAAFRGAANPPILAGGQLVIAGRKLTRGVGELEDGGSHASRLTTPIRWTQKIRSARRLRPHHRTMDGEGESHVWRFASFDGPAAGAGRQTAVEAVQDARRAVGSGMKGVAEEMADKLGASAGACDRIDGMAGGLLGDRMRTR
jgi:hypothetical protein